MATTTDRFARRANLAPPPRRGSGTKDPTTALVNIPHEVTSTHSTAAATHPPTPPRKRCPASSVCPSDAQNASIVVPSDYALPDLTLDLLAAIVVSAAKRAKTEAA